MCTIMVAYPAREVKRRFKEKKEFCPIFWPQRRYEAAWGKRDLFQDRIMSVLKSNARGAKSRFCG
jgi:hypothetical protein